MSRIRVRVKMRAQIRVLIVDLMSTIRYDRQRTRYTPGLEVNTRGETRVFIHPVPLSVEPPCRVRVRVRVRVRIRVRVRVRARVRVRVRVRVRGQVPLSVKPPCEDIELFDMSI